MEFLARGFSLTQPWLLWALAGMNQWVEDPSVSVSMFCMFLCILSTCKQTKLFFFNLRKMGSGANGSIG